MTSPAEFNIIRNGGIRVNELTPNITGMSSDNPLATMDSTMRQFMSGSMKGQMPAVDGCSAPIIFTGQHKNFGEYTNQVRAPANSRVVAIIPRHRAWRKRDQAKDRLPYPSVTYILETDEFDSRGMAHRKFTAIELERFFSRHKQFGAEQVIPDDALLNVLREKGRIYKDQVLSQSPSIDKDTGLWTPGVQVNTASMTVPQVIEDGILVSDYFVDMMTMTCVEKKVISFGKKRFPLNIHGDDAYFKLLPDIGEKVGSDGLLFAARDYDARMAPVIMSRAACQIVDHDRDFRVVVEPGAEVADIKVFRSPKPSGRNRGSYVTPIGMEAQLEAYCESDIQHYKQVLDTYHKSLRGRRETQLSISPDFHPIYNRAKMYVEGIDDPKMTKTYSGPQETIDEWMAEVTITYKLKPGIGSKFSGIHGNKGVVTAILPRHMMPVDKDGNIADVVECPMAVFGRMIMGHPTQRELGASALALTKRLREEHAQGASEEYIVDTVRDWWETISPDILPNVGVPNDEGGFDLVPEEIMHMVVNDVLRIPLISGARFEPDQVIPNLVEKYPGCYDRIQFYDTYGQKRISKRPILIGPQLMIPLEKHGQKPAASYCGLLNHYGTLCGPNKENKGRHLFNNKGTRFGEEEFKLLAAIVGQNAAADIMDRSTNQEARRQVAASPYEAKGEVTWVEESVDRRTVPIGGSRVIETLDHVTECYGRKITWDL